MNSVRKGLVQVTLLLIFFSTSSAARIPIAIGAGFYLPDSINEMTIRYKVFKNLIILPVVINDSITVNLILDTGCRNLVLFGKQFQKLLKMSSGRQIQFSGLGSGAPVYGSLSLDNKVSIHQVLGEQIPIVVVPNKNILDGYRDIHGVVGYEIFLKFEIELDPRRQTITFRPGARASAPAGFKKVPLKLIDSRPVIDSEIVLTSKASKKCELMIDTGSALGLLLKTTNLDEFTFYENETSILGYGFNGQISGFRVLSEVLRLATFDMFKLPTGIIESPWHNYASIGMAVLKDYVVVLNYCKSYACFKSI
jgi:hypothetical protein